MPEAISAAVAFMGSTGIEILGVEIMTSQAIFMAGTIAIGGAQKRRAQARARAAYLASLKDRELTIRSAVAPRRYVYGRDRVSGPLVYAETTGAKREFLHLVIALAAHECDAIEEVWFGDEKLPDPDASGFITGGAFGKATTHGATESHTPSGGSITLAHVPSRIIGISYYPGGDTGNEIVTGWSHTPGSATITDIGASGIVTVDYEWIEGQTRVRIKRHLGQPGQVADADLVAESAGQWTAAHKGTGICYLYARLQWDADIFASTGVPDIKCVVRGRKLADARTSTVVWSDNAALAVADWLQRTEGLRAGAAQVPAAEVIDAANIADESIELSAGGPTQPRYTFNGSFTADQSPRDVLEELLQAMAGTAVWVQGRWLVRAGAYRTPAPAITPAHLAGGLTITPKASRSTLFNAVRATYRDPAQGWAEVQAPLVTNAMYEAEDGGVRRVRDIQLASAMDAMRAQRLAKIELERGRQALTVGLATSLRGYDLAPTDVVPLQFERYGWATGKDFEVLERTYNVADGTLQYTMRETAAGVWAWNYGEATTVDLAPDTSLPSPYARPAALTDLAVASGTAHLLRQVDGTLLTRAYVTWTASADAFVTGGGRIELQWREVGTEQWQAEPPLDGGASSAYVAPVPDGVLVIFRVRPVNAIGVTGEWTSLMVTVLGKTEPPGDVTGLTSSVAGGVIPWRWDNCPDIDYKATEVRATDADWGSDAVPPLFIGRVSEWLETVSAAGTYTRHFRHLDTGGRPSANTATRAQVVGSADLGDGAASSGLAMLPPILTLTADGLGTVSSFNAARSSARVLGPDGTDETALWGYTRADVGVTSTLGGALGNEVQITGFAADAIDPDFARVVVQSHLHPNAADLGRYALPMVLGAGAAFSATDGVIGTGYVRFTGSNWFTKRITYGPDDRIVDVTGGSWRMSGWMRVRAGVDVQLAVLGYFVRNIYCRLSGSTLTIGGMWWRGGGTSQIYLSATRTHDADAWLHVLFGFDRGTNTLRLYVNGTQVASQSITDSIYVDDMTGDADTYSRRWYVGSSTGSNQAVGSGPDIDIAEHRFLVGVAPPSATFTPPALPFAHGASVPSAHVDVTASRSGQADLVARLDVTTILGAAPVVSATLSQSTAYLPATWDGTVTGSALPVTVKISVDGVDQSADWIIKAVAQDGFGLSYTLSGQSITVSGMGAGQTSSKIYVWCGRAGYPTQLLTLAVVKDLAPKPAQVSSVSPAVIVLAGATNGVVPAASYTGASATAKVTEGGVDATSSYAWGNTPSAGLTVSQSGATVTVTAMDAGTDGGAITIYGTKGGWPAVFVTVQVQKTKTLVPDGTVADWGTKSAFVSGVESTSTCGLRLTPSGAIEATQDGSSWSQVGLWFSPITAGAGNALYVFAGGTAAGLTGALNTWQQLSSTRAWTVTSAWSGLQIASASLDILISTTADGSNIIGHGRLALYSVQYAAGA